MAADAEVEVFDLDSGGLTVAFLGSRGSDGVLIHRKDKGWEFHASLSVTWDGLHQTVYRNYRADQVKRAELEDRGISWPDPENYRSLPGPKTWAENFCSEIPAESVPKDILKRITSKPVAVHIVLQEDLYETGFGDGKFLEFHGAFWDAEQARSHLEWSQDEQAAQIAAGFYNTGCAYTSKEIELRRDGRKVVADLKLDTYEHYDLESVLAALDPKSASRRRRSCIVPFAEVPPALLERLRKLPHGEMAECVWVVYQSGEGIGTIPRAAYWEEGPAKELAQRRKSEGEGHFFGAVPLTICAHQPGERLVAYIHWHEYALSEVLALLKP
ncbi:MAG: hypothetical protein HY077_11595 [Elusimicrobia bacterium]|nr:hypothetical protein [Elusimicrobiota bacterium]